MVSKPMVEDTLLRDMPEFSTPLLQEQPAGCLAGAVCLFLVERQILFEFYIPTVEKAPTLSAGRKILVAAKAAHYRRPQSLGDSRSQD
jgi:hypothetical protein